MLYDFIYVKFRNKQKQSRILEISIVVAPGRSRKYELTARRHRETFCANVAVPYLDLVGGCMSVYVCKNFRLYT